MKRKLDAKNVPRRLACLAVGSMLAIGAGCGSAEEATAPSHAQPNIILIVADDLGYGDIGANGSKTIATPHIDELAARGVRFTDGYVSGAVCSPTRAGLVSGRYQNRFGYEYNPTANYDRGPDAELGLPLDQRTLGNLMQDAGYATGLVGKWHLGALEKYNPLNRGFDEFYGILGGGTNYIDCAREGAQCWPQPLSGDRSSPSGAREIMDGFEIEKVEDYLTDVFAAKAVDFIDRHSAENAEKPFFLMLTPNAPHTPIQATDEYVDRFPHIEGEGARSFAAMVSAVDDMVGDVTATLRQHGIEDNTLVAFISDNGCINYASAPICTNAPLSGNKRYHLEGGVRVPFLMKWPAGLPAGEVFEQPAIHLDFYATFGAAAGLDASNIDSPDSVNLLPHLRGENTEPPHEFLFWRSAPNMSVRWGKWKMWKVDKSNLDESALGGARLLPEVDYPAVSPNGQMTVLYDLSVDIGEQQNLADEHPEIVERLEAELEAWNEQLVDPMWTSRRSTLDTINGQMVQLYF